MNSSISPLFLTVSISVLRRFCLVFALSIDSKLFTSAFTDEYSKRYDSSISFKDNTRMLSSSSIEKVEPILASGENT
jgi:hypothetical protein